MLPDGVNLAQAMSKAPGSAAGQDLHHVIDYLPGRIDGKPFRLVGRSAGATGLVAGVHAAGRAVGEIARFVARSALVLGEYRLGRLPFSPWAFNSPHKLCPLPPVAPKH